MFNMANRFQFGAPTPSSPLGSPFSGLSFGGAPSASSAQGMFGGGTLSNLLALGMVAAPYVTNYLGNRTQQAAIRQSSQDAQRAAAENRAIQEQILAQQKLLEDERNKIAAEQFLIQQKNIAAANAEAQRQFEMNYGIQKARQDFEMAELERRRAAAEPYRQQVAAYLASPAPSIIPRS